MHKLKCQAIIRFFKEFKWYDRKSYSLFKTYEYRSWLLLATQEIKLGIQDGMPDVKSGTRVFTSLKVTDAPDGTPVFIPLIIVKGEKEGPTLLVDGCHHGAEVEGTEAIVRLARSLDTKALKGTFIGVPVLNVAAFMARERFNPLDRRRFAPTRPGSGRELPEVCRTGARAFFKISLMLAIKAMMHLRR